MPETVTKKESQKATAPEGLTDAEVQAWKESLPEPAEEPKAETKDTGKRLEDLEGRIAKLEELLNVKLEA